MPDREDRGDKTAIVRNPTLTTEAAAPAHAYLIVIAGANVGEMFRVQEGMVIGRGTESDVRILDDEISRRHARLSAGPGGVSLEDLGSTNGTFLNGRRVLHEPLKDGDKIQFGSTTILKFTHPDDLEAGYHRKMYESALQDGLTRLFNKRHFVDRLAVELAYAQRHAAPLALAMIDIDHFKRINDSHGHLAGDHVLSTIAGLLVEQVRAEDLVARWGGEEFALLCRGIPRAGVEVLAERLRRAIESASIVFGGVTLTVTVSVGIAIHPDTRAHAPDDLVEAADAALYRAKRDGRNRVAFAVS